MQSGVNFPEIAIAFGSPGKDNPNISKSHVGICEKQKMTYIPRVCHLKELGFWRFGYCCLTRFRSLIPLIPWNPTKGKNGRDWKVSELEKCQNWKVSELESVRIGMCQNWKVSEFESVRIGKCQNGKVSDLEPLVSALIQDLSHRMCQNWKVSEFESVKIGKCQN